MNEENNSEKNTESENFSNERENESSINITKDIESMSEDKVDSNIENADSIEGVKSFEKDTEIESQKKEESPENRVNKENKNSFMGILFGASILIIIALICILGVKSNEGGTSNIYESNRNKVESVDVSNGDILTPSQIYAKNIDSVVAIQTEMAVNIFGQLLPTAASGSGFVITEDGYVVTNYHVIENANKIKVMFSDGREYSAEVVGSEEENDIAVIKIDSEDKFIPVVLGNSDEMQIGEEVVAIGNPLGELTFSMTQGIVSALDRKIQIDRVTTVNMFQVDCAVNQGNSGGPIFNQYGEVLGVVSAKYASDMIEGLGFCIPIDDVKKIATDLIEHGKVVDKAYMGITLSEIDPQIKQTMNLVDGAYVYSVEKGSPADKAGLKIGDIITKMGKDSIANTGDLMLAKRGYRAGDTVDMKVWRGGDVIDIKITFEEVDSKKMEETQKEIDEKMNGKNHNYMENLPDKSELSPEEMEEIFRYFFGN